MTSRIRLLALLLPFSLVAAACSDDDDDSESTEDATAEEAADESTDEEAAEETDSDADGEDADGEDADVVMMSEGTNMGSPPTGDTAELNIAQIAAGTPDVSVLTRLVITGGLFTTVRDGGPFTVFAPTNEAFAEVPGTTLEALRADRPLQADIILNHVVPGTFSSEDLVAMDGGTLETANGNALLVEVDGEEVTVGGAVVVLPDVEASNGMIHVVDAVIAQPNG